MNALAFDRKMLPRGSRLNAMFASDIGHWEVPDMTEVLPEAWELIERDHLDRSEFADFTCFNAIRMLTSVKPGFFEGTAVEAVARKTIGEYPATRQDPRHLSLKGRTSMDLELENRVAVVTGGSRGIGRAIARELALEGAITVVVARGAEALEATAAELENETGRRVVPIVADTTDGPSIQAMVDRILSEYGRLDILVNNAAPPGGFRPPALSEITSSHFEAEMNVKVMGYLRCAQAVAPIMQTQGWGRIINVSGLAARMAGSIVGSMRNVSVAAMSKNLADLLGPSGINVTVVHPGATRTERTIEAVAREATRRGVTEAELEEEIGQANSIQHFVDAREVAWVVTFLASPKSIAISGDAIAVGGGQKTAIYY